MHWIFENTNIEVKRVKLTQAWSCKDQNHGIFNSIITWTQSNSIEAYSVHGSKLSKIGASLNQPKKKPVINWQVYWKTKGEKQHINEI